MAPAEALEQRASVATFIEWSYVRKVLDELETREDLPTSLRRRAILFLAYFADLKPGEISSLQTSSIRILSLKPVPVWQLVIENRPPNVREVLLLPPAQTALQKYLDSRGIAVGANASDAPCPVIVSSRDTQYWTGTEENLSEHTVQRSTREVFQLAAKLAQSSGDTAAARRLSGATLHWLRHAFEVHTVQLHSGKHWCWHLLGAYWLARYRGRLYVSRPLLKFAVAMGPSGLIAVLAGWVTTEVGRQPWTVYGLMRTAESASPLAAPAVAASLAAFVVIYFLVFGAGVLYIFKLLSKPPVSHEPELPDLPVRTAGITPAPAIAHTSTHIPS